MITSRAVNERAEPGAALIVPMAARKSVNLRTHLERIIAKAGHEPWPRLVQNLRASCETDWVENYPSHVVAKWLGHSPKVAAQHYMMAREHHFDAVVRGGRGARRRWRAATHFAQHLRRILRRSRAPSGTARDRTKRHNPLQPRGLQRVLRKFAQFPKLARGRTPRKKQAAGTWRRRA